MVIGPLTGWNVFLFDKYIFPKVKAGYEMLVRNFSAGIIGMLLGYLSLGLHRSVHCGRHAANQSVCRLVDPAESAVVDESFS